MWASRGSADPRSAALSNDASGCGGCVFGVPPLPCLGVFVSSVGVGVSVVIIVLCYVSLVDSLFICCCFSRAGSMRHPKSLTQVCPTIIYGPIRKPFIFLWAASLGGILVLFLFAFTAKSQFRIYRFLQNTEEVYNHPRIFRVTSAQLLRSMLCTVTSVPRRRYSA